MKRRREKDEEKGRKKEEKGKRRKEKMKMMVPLRRSQYMLSEQHEVKPPTATFVGWGVGQGVFFSYDESCFAVLLCSIALQSHLNP